MFFATCLMFFRMCQWRSPNCISYVFSEEAVLRKPCMIFRKTNLPAGACHVSQKIAVPEIRKRLNLDFLYLHYFAALVASEKSLNVTMRFPS